MRKEDYFKAKRSNADQEPYIDDVDGGYYSRLIGEAKERAEAKNKKEGYNPWIDDYVPGPGDDDMSYEDFDF